jgi:hypothetical protein
MSLRLSCCNTTAIQCELVSLFGAAQFEPQQLQIGFSPSDFAPKFRNTASQFVSVCH